MLKPGDLPVVNTNAISTDCSVGEVAVYMFITINEQMYKLLTGKDFDKFK
jgi:hypothetical protein